MGQRFDVGEDAAVRVIGDGTERRDAGGDVGRGQGRALRDRLDLPAQVGVGLGCRRLGEEGLRQLGGTAPEHPDRRRAFASVG